MHLLLTRADVGRDDDPLEAALLAAGHSVLVAPLLTIAPTGHRPSFEGAQAVIATSRNGLRAVSDTPLTQAVLALPLYAVGPATAALARGLGFRRVVEGPGTGRGLAETIRRDAKAGAGDLVHLAGETLAFDLRAALAPDGLKVRIEPVYRAVPADALPAEAAQALASGTLDAVVLMSPRTAKVYADLTKRAGLLQAACNPRYLCLSEAVARELSPLGDVQAKVADAPNAEEMLALITREAPDSP
jgi:uroporphyrinogen-III synthase